MFASAYNLIFKHFIYVYDAGFFGLFYAFKAMMAICRDFALSSLALL